MAIRQGVDAVNWAARQVTDPSQNWRALCLKFVRSSFNVAAVYGSAEAGWYGTMRRRGTGTTPPAGTPVWWTNGRHGHVVISAGGGYCYSNDIRRVGKIDRVSIAYITRQWGQTYRGWTEDINGVRVYGGLLPPAPVPEAAPHPTGAPADGHGRRVMSYNALIAAGRGVPMATTDRYHIYRAQAMKSLKALGFAAATAADVSFPQAWLTLERAIRRSTPTTVPDRYSFEWFVDACGYWYPDGSAPSLGIHNDWPQEARDR